MGFFFEIMKERISKATSPSGPAQEPRANRKSSMRKLTRSGPPARESRRSRLLKLVPGRGTKKNPPVREGSDVNLADQIDGLTTPPVKHLTIAKTIDPIIPIDIITMKIIIPSITAF